jgi:hypothetical protein
VGFAYHILVHVALTGSGKGVGGYYLHVLVAPLSFALAIGISAAWRSRGVRILAAIHLAYVALFVVAVTWAQLLLFAGVLTKNDARQYALVGSLPPWLGLSEAFERLAVLAFPRIAAALAVAGFAALAYAGVLLLQRPMSSATEPGSS